MDNLVEIPTYANQHIKRTERVLATLRKLEALTLRIMPTVGGDGHAFLLRLCVCETPGHKLVEANDYIPERCGLRRRDLVSPLDRTLKSRSSASYA